MPIGADDRIFSPTLHISEKDPIIFNILYYGTFIPNHGTCYMIEAASILRNKVDIRFTFVGDGPDLSKCKELATRYELKNVTFVDWLEKEKLIAVISPSHVILGSFGAATQSYLTVHNKVYEGMAMKKIVLTGDSPAIRENFTNGHELLTCERSNADSLANAILKLHSDRRLMKSIARNGYEYYQSHSTLRHMGLRLKNALQELIQQA